MKTIDWGKASPGVADLTGAVNASNNAASQLFESIGQIGKTAKDYGDAVTERNTQELLTILNQAKTPEELEGTISNIQQMAQEQFKGNIDEKSFNAAISSKPNELMNSVMNQQKYGDFKTDQADREYMPELNNAYMNSDLVGMQSALNNLTNPDNQEKAVGQVRSVLGEKADAQRRSDALARQQSQDELALARHNETMTRLGGLGGNSGGSSGSPPVVKATDSNRTEVNPGAAYTEVVNFEDGKPVRGYLGGNVVQGAQAVKDFLFGGTGAVGAIVNSESSLASVGKNVKAPNSTARGWAQVLEGTYKDAMDRHPNGKAFKSKYGSAMVTDESNPEAYKEMLGMVMDLKLDHMKANNPDIPVTPLTGAIVWQLGEGNIRKFWDAYKANPNTKMNDVGMNFPGYGSNFTASQKMNNKDFTVGDLVQRKLTDLQINENGELLKGGGHSTGIPATEFDNFVSQKAIELSGSITNRQNIGTVKDPDYQKKSPTERAKIAGELAEFTSNQANNWWGTNPNPAIKTFKDILARENIVLNPEMELALYKRAVSENEAGTLQMQPYVILDRLLKSYSSILRESETAQLQTIESAIPKHLLEFGIMSSKYRTDGSIDATNYTQELINRVNPALYNRYINRNAPSTSPVEARLQRAVRAQAPKVYNPKPEGIREGAIVRGNRTPTKKPSDYANEMRVTTASLRAAEKAGDVRNQQLLTETLLNIHDEAAKQGLTMFKPNELKATENALIKLAEK